MSRAGRVRSRGSRASGGCAPACRRHWASSASRSRSSRRDSRSASSAPSSRAASSLRPKPGLPRGADRSSCCSMFIGSIPPSVASGEFPRRSPRPRGAGTCPADPRPARAPVRVRGLRRPHGAARLAGETGAARRRLARAPQQARRPRARPPRDHRVRAHRRPERGSPRLDPRRRPGPRRRGGGGAGRLPGVVPPGPRARAPPRRLRRAGPRRPLRRRSPRRRACLAARPASGTARRSSGVRTGAIPRWSWSRRAGG